jgi:single-strand DNA-binding protein
MNNLQRILVLGRLGKNPELKYTQKQEPVCYFSLAVNAEKSEVTKWHNIVVWGKQAESCSMYLKKGNFVFVQGQIISREYTNKQGEKKAYTEFKADTIGFIH